MNQRGRDALPEAVSLESKARTMPLNWGRLAETPLLEQGLCPIAQDDDRSLRAPIACSSRVLFSGVSQNPEAGPKRDRTVTT
jgi:hypothetical protein